MKYFLFFVCTYGIAICAQNNTPEEQEPQYSPGTLNVNFHVSNKQHAPTNNTVTTTALQSCPQAAPAPKTIIIINHASPSALRIFAGAALGLSARIAFSLLQGRFDGPVPSSRLPRLH